MVETISVLILTTIITIKEFRETDYIAFDFT